MDNSHPQTKIDPFAEHPGQTFLFSYGSNNPRQAAERLEVDYDWLCRYTVACEAVNRVLTFGWYSSRWSGAVANMSVKQGEHCKGLAYLLPNDVLNRMDKYEGGYEKEEVQLSYNGKHFKGVAYIQDTVHGGWHHPSRRYLEAVGKTLVHYFHCKKVLQHHKEVVINVKENNTLAEKGNEKFSVEELKDATHK